MALMVQLDNILFTTLEFILPLTGPVLFFFLSLPQINWQERCLELQLELHRSKTQAGRFQNRLREKVSGRLFYYHRVKGVGWLLPGMMWECEIESIK